MVVCSIKRMTRRSVVNLVLLGNRAVSLLNGNSLRPLHTSVYNTSSQPESGFKPEKVAVVTKTTRYEFEQQRYRYAGLSEEDLKQLVRLHFTVSMLVNPRSNEHLRVKRTPSFDLSLGLLSFAVPVFCSLQWRAPATAACWKDTTSTLTMWNILWRACGKMWPITERQICSSDADREGLLFCSRETICKSLDNNWMFTGEKALMYGLWREENMMKK